MSYKEKWDNQGEEERGREAKIFYPPYERYTSEEITLVMQQLLPMGFAENQIWDAIKKAKSLDPNELTTIILGSIY